MRNHLSRRAGLMGILASAALWRQSAVAQTVPDVAVDVARAAFVAPPDNEADIEAQIQAWLQASGYAARDGKDLTVAWKIAPVQLPASNPDWVKARTIAVADAYLQAQADFIAAQMVDIQSKTVGEFTKGPDVPPAFRQDVTANGEEIEIIRKILGVANGQLDAKLRELGIDPQKYQSLPDPQKTDLLRNQIKLAVTKRAFASVAGMVPVNTFEGHDGAQNFQVGVVAVASPLMVDFARQVLTARGQFTPEPARAGDTTRFYKDPAQLLGQFGVRRGFDEQGLPLIVSFAQWGSSYRGPDGVMAANYRSAARLQAQSLADAQIADFLKASADATSTSSTGQEIARVAAVLPDVTTVEESVRMVDEIKRSIKRIAQVQVSGLRTLHSWTGKHPASPVPILGVIRMWSAASEQNMRALSNARQRPPAIVPGAAGPRGQAGVTSSQPLMDATDF